MLDANAWSGTLPTTLQGKTTHMEEARVRHGDTDVGAPDRAVMAAVLQDVGDLVVRDWPVREPAVGELLLSVEAATVCGTDLRIMTGAKTSNVAPPVVLGHEIAGRVLAAGDGVDGFAVGDQVGVAPIISCGTCAHCRLGLENACRRVDILGYNLDGGLAERLLVPAHAVARGNVVATTSEVAPEQLCIAEPLSCVLNGHERTQVAPGDAVLIMGAGAIGLLHTQLARLSGASHVIVSEPLASRREVAADLGATTTVDPTAEDLATVVADATGGLGADATVICIGVPALVDEALHRTRVGGRVNIFAGLAGEGRSEIAANLIHYHELTVTGVTGSRRRDYERAVRLIEQGAVNVAPLVTHRFAVADARAAIEIAAGNEGLKSAVVPGAAA